MRSGAELRAVLEALTPKIRACPQRFRPQHVAAALYGLRLTADSPATRGVLKPLAEKVRALGTVHVDPIMEMHRTSLKPPRPLPTLSTHLGTPARFKILKRTGIPQTVLPVPPSP